jgi:two-component system OmpR family sensor kinase
MGTNAWEQELIELRQRVVALEAAVRARDDFIAIAAHELRNPMQPILGTAELALAAARKAGSACPPRITQLLESMQNLVENYVTRATRLLDITRIEAGNLRLEPSRLDLSALVEAVTEKYRIPASRTRTTLEAGIEPGITGVWDRLAIEQIVDNLLSNAIKFGAGKPVTIRLKAAEGQARLEVQDRGVGLSPEQQSRIFGRFEQVVSTHRGSGFGIGLWVASRLLTAMGGQIAVESQLGKGSTFSMMLPLKTITPDGEAS